MFQDIFRESMASGRGGKMMIGAGVAAGLLASSHVMGALNSETIDLPKGAPLPRNVPLDQLEYDSATFDVAPQQQVRLTTGGDMPMRANMDMAHNGEEPSHFIDKMRGQASIGVGTIIMDDTNSMDRIEYNNYRQERHNSRF